MTDGLKEWKKPEVTDISSEEPVKEKAELTEELKDHIRQDLELDTYDTPEKAKKRRTQLAIFYGTNVQQIGAVSAYKKRDGKLSLEAKFEKLPPAPPKIETEYDNFTKRAWRQKIFNAIKNDFTQEQLQRARVLCFPGQALQEVTEVYLPLGIRPENIVCIEKDPDVVKTMRKNLKALIQTKVLSQSVSIFEGSVEEFLQSSHEPVTIASFDLLGPMYEGFLMSIPNLRVADKFMVITNCLQRREQKNQQDALKSMTSATRAVGSALDALQNYKHILPGVGSTSFDVSHLMAQIARANQQPIDLSEARDEGAAITMIAFLLGGQAKQSLDDLYSEASIVPPRFKSDDDRQAFEDHTLGTLIRGIEQLVINYSRVYSRLSLKSDVNILENTLSRSDTGKHGFLLHFLTVATHCMSDLTICDLQRYEYSSEKSGSPYQTDVITLFDWKRNFREKHREAYHFIRDCFRVIGQHSVDQISFQFKKGITVLPKNYAGSNAKIDLTVNVNGKQFLSISFSKLLELVAYFRKTEKIVTKGKIPQDFLERPRIKIET
ncbi:MAG: hypothetical protein G01um10148_242 [Parcubacteria group bacterium Gr01-1014_8]|nr:MAG: hypothetical protein G01um10148_242 [Parcubacteria group bacterium Gr01-1014_8]